VETLLTPPVAFLIYILLVSLLSGAGRILSGPSRPATVKSSPYASGEKTSPNTTAPGYSPFFRVALFFAVLHLGAVVVATGGLSLMAGGYLLGLILVLIALILG
jgi:NADH:ubiquinone oxidoreductase subunit 3 (subunit A)